MTNEMSGLIWTDSGMFGLWDPASFRGVVDYHTWDAAIGEDERIQQHVAAGAFVPININSDGAFSACLQVGSPYEPSGLTAREARYEMVRSEPYLFVSSGEAWISGIERVGSPDEHGFAVVVPNGRWIVTVHLVDWAAEPGSVATDGGPGPDALVDFVLLLKPERSVRFPYSTRLVTFDRPD